MSNRDKAYTPADRAAVLARVSAQTQADKDKNPLRAETRRTSGSPPPPSSTGRDFQYEWEVKAQELQTQIDVVVAGGGGGGGSGAATVVHAQSAPAAVWTINHALATKPNVLIVDDNGHQLIAQVDYPSNSQVVVTHANPYTGTAYLRA